MPKYYCDYCDAFLTRDSSKLRKTHNEGRRHKDSVRAFYQKWMEEQAQKMIDATARSYTEQRMQGAIPRTTLGMGGPPQPLMCAPVTHFNPHPPIGMMPPPMAYGGYPGGPPPPHMVPRTPAAPMAPRPIPQPRQVPMPGISPPGQTGPIKISPPPAKAQGPPTNVWKKASGVQGGIAPRRESRFAPY